MAVAAIGCGKQDGALPANAAASATTSAVEPAAPVSDSPTGGC
jgi:hypothetical protein